MTRLQKAQLKQSQLRSEIAEELDKNEEERTDGLLDSLSKDLQAAEVRAALLIEEESGQPDEVIAAGTPEHREMVELRSRVDFGEYVKAALAGQGVINGPEAELNQELGLRSDYFPLDVLATGRSNTARPVTVMHRRISRRGLIGCSPTLRPLPWASRSATWTPALRQSR